MTHAGAGVGHHGAAAEPVEGQLSHSHRLICPPVAWKPLFRKLYYSKHPWVRQRGFSQLDTINTLVFKDWDVLHSEGHQHWSAGSIHKQSVLVVRRLAAEPPQVAVSCRCVGGWVGGCLCACGVCAKCQLPHHGGVFSCNQFSPAAGLCLLVQASESLFSLDITFFQEAFMAWQSHPNAPPPPPRAVFIARAYTSDMGAVTQGRGFRIPMGDTAVVRCMFKHLADCAEMLLRRSALWWMMPFD